MKTQRNVFQIKQQIKVTGKFHNLMEVNNLPDEAFTIMVTKMLTELHETDPQRRRMAEHRTSTKT